MHFLANLGLKYGDDNSEDESGNSEEPGSDEDDASVGSNDSRRQQVKNHDEAIPHDGFDCFTFWLPKIWEYCKPCLLNDVVCAVYLLSLNPIMIIFAPKSETMDPEDRLACEQLIS
jgi:hypothetical protein